MINDRQYITYSFSYSFMFSDIWIQRCRNHAQHLLRMTEFFKETALCGLDGTWFEFYFIFYWILFAVCTMEYDVQKS